MKITEAWTALDAAPKYPRSWSAWSQDRNTLFITLPEPDVQADGRTITLWDKTWKNRAFRTSATNTEQEANLRDAIAFSKPIVGFRVVMDAEEKRIKAAFPNRLLPMKLLIVDGWHIVGQAPEPIKLRP
jgi:hypothetical protein